MNLDIAGKIAFVSGGSRGIGRKVAELFAQEGCRVIIAARQQQAIDETVQAIRSSGGSAVGVSADLISREGVDKAVEAGFRAFGGTPDIALNNVHGPGSGNLMELTPAQFEQAFRDMAISNVNLAQAVLPGMQAKGWGRYVSINSGAAKEPPKDLKHILANTARASVVSFNKSIANEYAKYNITVNTIGTGYVGSERMYEYVDMVAKERGITPEQQLKEACAGIPLGRPGKPEEMAALIAFLCSEPGGYVTGTFIPFDGGIHQSAW